jgi:hypothetical protein
MSATAPCPPYQASATEKQTDFCACVCAIVTQGNRPTSLAVWDPANAVWGFNSRTPCCRHRLRLCRVACLLLSRSNDVASRICN